MHFTCMYTTHACTYTTAFRANDILQDEGHGATVHGLDQTLLDDVTVVRSLAVGAAPIDPGKLQQIKTLELWRCQVKGYGGTPKMRTLWGPRRSVLIERGVLS